MTLAAIDIGSNTFLLLVARYRNGRLEIVHEQQHAPRLGRGIDKSGNLHPDAMQKALHAITSFKTFIKNNYPDTKHTLITATSAVRDATNKDQFLRLVKEQTGYEIEVLSGSEEAKLTFSGAVGMLKGVKQGLVVDIGGGSTELIVGTDDKPEEFYSYQMGSVRFTERYLVADPPTEEELLKCRKGIKKVLDQHPLSIGNKRDRTGNKIIGVAGTVTSLACMDMGYDTYKSSRIHGHRLSFETIRYWIKQVSAKSSEDLRTGYPAVMEGRAEVFLAGLLILEGVMEFYKLQELIVTTGGIRHGAIFRKIGEIGDGD